MGNTIYFSWEPALMEFLQTAGGSFTKAFGTLFTMFGDDALIVVIIGALYLGYNKEWVKYIVPNFIIGMLSGSMIKNVVRRLRPYMVHANVQCLKPVKSEADIMNIAVQGYSFPSLHSTNSMSIYGSIAKLSKKKFLRIILIILIIGIGLSRFCLGVHYPTDVMIGWLLGFVSLLLGTWFQEKVKNHLIRLAILAGCALPGWFFCTSHDFYTGYGLLVGLELSFYLEEKIVHFENTNNIFLIILRTAGGGVIYAVFNTLLKLPFPEDVLTADNFLAFFIRASRYAIVTFIMFGIYPMCFKYIKFKK